MQFPNIFKKSRGRKEEPNEASKKEARISLPKENQETSKVFYGGSSVAVLVSPHVTEKASLLSQSNQYVFKVAPHANKYTVKKAIQEAYGMVAERINMVNIPAKKRRKGKKIGFVSGYKKAIVTLKKGQRIEVLPR